MAEVAECASDARVTPAAVFMRHTQHELDDVRSSTRFVRPATAGAVVLLSDEPAVPAKQCVRRHQRVEPRERFAPELLGCGCEPAPLRFRVRDSLVTERWRRTAFSASRYSVTSRWSRVIQPATVNSRNCNGKLDIVPTLPPPLALRTQRQRFGRIEEVSDFLGHSDVRITKTRYAHLTADSKRAAAALVDSRYEREHDRGGRGMARNSKHSNSCKYRELLGSGSRTRTYGQSVNSRRQTF
jgi:hypothetical protein